MCNITLELALIQSLLNLLKIYKIKNLGNANSAVISPMLPKRREQIYVLRSTQQFYVAKKFKLVFVFSLICCSVFVLTF